MNLAIDVLLHAGRSAVDLALAWRLRHGRAVRRRKIADWNLSRPRGAQFAPYGAAGALIVLMFWTYYSAQIFLFGAELTKAIADERAPADRLGSKRT